MAWYAASQMWRGVLKSGSPRLKSKTVLPAAFSCRAFAPAANVAEGCTAAAIFEIGNISCFLDRGSGPGYCKKSRTTDGHRSKTESSSRGMSGANPAGRYENTPGIHFVHPGACGVTVSICVYR